MTACLAVPVSVALFLSIGAVVRARLTEQRRVSQARAVADYIANYLTPFRMQDHRDVDIDQAYWSHCLELSVRTALRSEERQGGVLRIRHNNFHRPDPVLLRAARRAFGGNAPIVSRSLVPVEVWFGRHMVKARFVDQFQDAGQLIWSDCESAPWTSAVLDRVRSCLVPVP